MSALVALGGCDRSSEIELPPEPPEGPAPAPMAARQDTNLTLPPQGMPARQLELSPPKLWGACHELLEGQNGAPRARYPFATSPEREAQALFGCDIEAYEHTENGRRLLAYALPPNQKGATARDLRVAVWGADDELAWSHRLDRSDQGGSFWANIRDSFVTDVPPHLICAGTRWEGSVQTMCAQAETGEPVWQGRLPYWSGVPPQGRNKSLYVADLSGLRRVYPWTGVEMRYVEFDGPGGRASLYVTDGERLYFSAVREGPWRLTAWSFDRMEPDWSRDLPAQPDHAWHAAFPEHDLVLIKTGHRILGIDTEDGQPRWALDVGEDAPKVAASPESIFVLVRRPEVANLLHALDPRTGEHQWWAETPTGTLRVAWHEGALMLGSVRAIQRVNHPAPSP